MEPTGRWHAVHATARWDKGQQAWTCCGNAAFLCRLCRTVSSIRPRKSSQNNHFNASFTKGLRREDFNFLTVHEHVADLCKGLHPLALSARPMQRCRSGCLTTGTRLRNANATASNVSVRTAWGGVLLI
eukprot:5821844-Amphidinium_carterae.1